MKFALATAPQHTTWDRVLAVWQAADEMAVFESAWTFDHFYPIEGDTHGPCLEGWMTLAALAQATRRLRLGTLVTGMVYRHPAVLANMAATLDIVSGGRLELGVGAGWNEEECGAYGIDLGTMTQRFDRFAEGLAVLDSLLRAPTTDFEGHYYQLRDARCEPKPRQRPRPPIVIGGTGPRRTLPLVARYADHWNYPGPAAELPALRAVLAAECAAIGRDPAEVRISSLVWHRDGLAAMVEQAAAYASAGVDLLFVSLPRPHDPADLAPLADVLGELVD